MAKEEKRQIQSYIAYLLDSQVEFLRQQLAGVSDVSDIEFVHHTRTMSRRIRNTLQVFEAYLGKKQSKRWFGEVRKLTKSLTSARDLDVQIDYLSQAINRYDQKFIQGLSRLLLRKKQRRDKIQPSVITTINDFSQSGVLDEMLIFVKEHIRPEESLIFPLGLYRLARQVIDERIRDCFVYVPFITNPENIEDLHNLRIAIKNLRYTCELFKKIYPDLSDALKTLKEFQELLGQIHDADVWLYDLAYFEQKEQKWILKFYGQSGAYNFIKPGITEFRKDIEQSRETLYQNFLLHWNQVFQNLFWSHLRETINQTPLLLEPGNDPELEEIEHYETSTEPKRNSNNSEE